MIQWGTDKSGSLQRIQGIREQWFQGSACCSLLVPRRKEDTFNKPWNPDVLSHVGTGIQKGQKTCWAGPCLLSNQQELFILFVLLWYEVSCCTDWWWIWSIAQTLNYNFPVIVSKVTRIAGLSHKHHLKYSNDLQHQKFHIFLAS